MQCRAVVAVVAVSAVLLWMPAAPAGQQPAAAEETWSSPRTPWGDPDLQGTWSNASTTPLERPADLAGQEVLTDEERAIRAPLVRLSDERPSGDPVGFYNDYWLEQGDLSTRTSLIVAPGDGRLPPTTASEQRLQATRMSSGSAIAGLRFASWADFNALDRCITRGLPGAMLPGVFYNHNYLIAQTPDYVAIAIEMVHDVRIIPLQERPAAAAGIGLWLGASRGRWEGDTLVVETANFTDKVKQRGGTVLGAGQQARLVERFTRVDADTIDYSVTVTDPAIWDAPWTASAPMTAMDGNLYEYACHEGNYAIPNALRGSRMAEQEESSK